MKRNSLLKNSIFGFLSWFLPLGLNFIATPLMVRGLGIEEYGVFTLILGFVSYSFTFSIGRAITKYVAEYQAAGQPEKISQVISATLILNLLVGGAGMAILVFMAKWFVVNLLQIESRLQDEAVAGFYFAAAIIFMTMLTQAFSAVVQAVHRFDIYSYITIGSSSLLSLGNIYLISLHPRIETLLIWNTVLSVLSTLVFYIYARRLLPFFKLQFSVPKEITSLVVKYSLAIVALQVLGNILLIYERSLISNKLGTQAVTYYVVPQNLGIYVHAFITSITLALFPLASEVKSLGDTLKLRQLYTKATKIVIVLAAFMCLTLINGRVFLLHLWLGDDFVRNSAATLVMHAITFSIVAIGIISFQMIEGIGQPKVNAILTLFWLLIGLPLMYLFINDYGIVGVGAARMIGALVFIPGILYIEKKVFGGVLWDFWRTVLPLMCISIVLASAIQFAAFANFAQSWLNFLAVVTVSGLIFCATLFFGGFVSKSEKEWARTQFDRRFRNAN